MRTSLLCCASAVIQNSQMDVIEIRPKKVEIAPAGPETLCAKFQPKENSYI